VSPEILADLRDVLVTLYSDEVSIQRVMADAGLTPARIKFNVAVLDVWHLVLTEAVNAGRMETLLVIVEREYAGNSKLRAACIAWRQAALAVQRSLAPSAIEPTVSEQSPPANHAQVYPPIINHDGAIRLFLQLLMSPCAPPLSAPGRRRRDGQEHLPHQGLPCIG
jgi:hypothetical protein